MDVIKFKRLHPDAKLPTYGSTGAACFDLYAVEDVSGRYRAVVCTGLAVELPPGKEMVIRSRSGLAFNRGLHAFHGTIDADYRGEIKVLLTAEDMLPFEIKAGERIAASNGQTTCPRRRGVLAGLAVAGCRHAMDLHRLRCQARQLQPRWAHRYVARWQVRRVPRTEASDGAEGLPATA